MTDEVIAKLKFWFGQDCKDLFNPKYLAEETPNGYVYVSTGKPKPNKELQDLVLNELTVGEIFCLWKTAYQRAYGELPRRIELETDRGEGSQ